MVVYLLSCVTLVTPWTVSHQAPLSLGFFQARILEWVAVFFSRGSSQSRDQTHISCVSCIGRQILYPSATQEALGDIIGVTAKVTMAIIVQYIHVSNDQVVHLEIAQRYMSNIFQLKKPF